MKSYTDLEQSKKLEKILPLESADMIWISIEDDESFEGAYEALPKGCSLVAIDDDTTPCWSLAALLELIPNYQLQTQYNSIGMIYGHKGELEIVEAKCPLDTCYEMIIKLHEKNLL